MQRFGAAVLDRPSHISRDTGADAARHSHTDPTRHGPRHVRSRGLATRSRGWTKDRSGLADNLSLLGETPQNSSTLCHRGSHYTTVIKLVSHTGIDPAYAKSPEETKPWLLILHVGGVQKGVSLIFQPVANES